jgi:predicted  nucleic acid-binding Zn-ribbon protein
MSKRCTACGQVFRPRPQIPNQIYYANPECQRERRRRWQQEKLKTDPDYRDNQSRSHKDWAKDNPEYWRQYRGAHPDYRQQKRNPKRLVGNIANMDVCRTNLLLPSER